MEGESFARSREVQVPAAVSWPNFEPHDSTLGTQRSKLSVVWNQIRETLRLGVPVVLVQLSQTSMTFVDTLMVGRLGNRELASVSLGNSVFFPVTVTLLGFLLATGPMVSQAFGAGRPKAIGRSLRQGLWMATVLAIPCFLVVRGAPDVLLLIGQDPRTVELSAGYLNAVSWGSLPLLWFGALRAFVEAVSRPRVVTVSAAGGVALNVVANYVLMFGKAGFPALGVRGCGWATTIVYWAMFAALLLYTRSEKDFQGYRLFSRLGTPDPEYFKELLRLGWPISVSLGVEVWFFSASALLMGLLGVVALSAHEIAIRCASFAFMVPLGLAIAASVRVGQAAGRGDLEGARRAGLAGLMLGGAVMGLSAIVFLTAPRWIISLFRDVQHPDNQQVVELAVTLLAVAALFQISDGIQVAAMGALRGLKDTRGPMLIAFLSYWVIGIGTGTFLGFAQDWGGAGIWWGLVTGLTTSAILLTRRFLRKTSAARQGEQGEMSQSASPSE